MRQFPWLGQDVTAPVPVSISVRSPMAPHPFFFVTPPGGFQAPETVFLTDGEEKEDLAVPILAAGALVLLGILAS